MHLMPTQKRLSGDQRKLLDLYAELGEADRHSLLAFADFLAQRGPGVFKEAESLLSEPLKIPRPAKESVVKAIKRLSASYPMLQRELLLDQTSSLMMAHVIHGRDAASVIDDLELMFEERYRLFLEQRQD